MTGRLCRVMCGSCFSKTTKAYYTFWFGGVVVVVMMMMNQQQMMSAFISGIRVMVAPASRVDLVPGSILIAEIHLKDDHPDFKVNVCKKINELLKLIKQTAPVQMVLAVINDDNGRYARLIGDGIEGGEVNVDEWPV